MSKFIIYTSLIFLLISGSVAYTYYYYVLDIEYHTFEIESEDDFIFTVKAPTQVKKSQRFSIYTELTYVGKEKVDIERRTPAVDIFVYNESNEEIPSFSPYSRKGDNQIRDFKMSPGDKFYLNLEYKIGEPGEYTILAQRKFFKIKGAESRLQEFEVPLPIRVGK
jgi:hypothetical protein